MMLNDFVDRERMIGEDLESNNEGAQSSSGGDDDLEGETGRAWEDTAVIEDDELEYHGEIEDVEEESSDEGQRAEGNFQARLWEIRSKEKSKARAAASEDDDEMEMDVKGLLPENNDEEFITEAQPEVTFLCEYQWDVFSTAIFIGLLECPCRDSVWQGPSRE